MDGIIKKIKGLFPVNTTKAVYIDGTNKTLHEAINDGTLTGTVITFDANQELDREGTIERLKAIENFLTEPTGKILKDFNANIWLVSITDNIPVAYYSEVGMGFAQVSFNWNEIGSATDSGDLYYNNLIEDMN